MYVGHFDFTAPLLSRVAGLWTAEACAAVLATVRDAEWLPATVNSAAGRIVDERVRNNDLALIRDPELAGRLMVNQRRSRTRTRQPPGTKLALPALTVQVGRCHVCCASGGMRHAPAIQT